MYLYLLELSKKKAKNNNYSFDLSVATKADIAKYVDDGCFFVVGCLLRYAIGKKNKQNILFIGNFI